MGRKSGERARGSRHLEMCRCLEGERNVICRGKVGRGKRMIRREANRMDSAVRSYRLVWSVLRGSSEDEIGEVCGKKSAKRGWREVCIEAEGKEG